MPHPKSPFGTPVELVMAFICSEAKKNGLGEVTGQMWVKAACKAANRDLRPSFAWWAWELSEELEAEVGLLSVQQ